MSKEFVDNICERLDDLLNSLKKPEENKEKWARHAIEELTEMTGALVAPNRHCVHGVPLEKRCDKCC
ncbi:MAG: hypothetical protein O7D91_21560 [Planctomycetota bacterium]|nr:hypothetical protein [Planctomycetota bacterium]